MSMKPLLHIGYIVFIVIFGAHTALGQVSKELPYVLPANDSGEVASLHLDVLAVEANKSGERLYVIAHKGSRDSNSKINLGRLAIARANRSVMNFDPTTTIFAQGNDVRGEGRLEFYLGSSLRLVLLAQRNKVPKLTCCDDYFPPSKNLRRKKKTR